MNKINFIIRAMALSDHPQLLSLWSSIDGLCIDEEDSYENMKVFLNRNIGLSYVAIVDRQIIGTIKGAQDGRRGYISHMAVVQQFRRLGIAKALYTKTLDELRKQGIWKCNLYVLNTNENAYTFWKHNGWNELEYNFKMLQINMKQNKW